MIARPEKHMTCASHSLEMRIYHPTGDRPTRLGPRFYEEEQWKIALIAAGASLPRRDARW
jgi:hypothetical protein